MSLARSVHVHPASVHVHMHTASEAAHNSLHATMSKEHAKSRRSALSSSSKRSRCRRVAHGAPVGLLDRHIGCRRIGSRRCSSTADKATRCCVTDHELQRSGPSAGSSGGHVGHRKQRESCHGADAARTARSALCAEKASSVQRPPL